MFTLVHTDKGSRTRTFLCLRIICPSGPNTGQLLYSFPPSSSGIDPGWWQATVKHSWTDSQTPVVPPTSHQVQLVLLRHCRQQLRGLSWNLLSVRWKEAASVRRVETFLKKHQEWEPQNLLVQCCLRWLVCVTEDNLNKRFRTPSSQMKVVLTMYSLSTIGVLQPQTPIKKILLFSSYYHFIQ